MKPRSNSLNFEAFFFFQVGGFFCVFSLPSPAFKRSVLILWEYKFSIGVNVY